MAGKFDPLLGEYREDDSTSFTTWLEANPVTPKRVITFAFDGNYASPTAATTASCVMGYDGSFTGWKIIEEAGTSSNIVLTIKKNGTAISGTEKPTLSSQSTNTDTSLTTWTTSFSKGDVIQAYVDSASTGVRYVCAIYAEASS